MAMNEEELVNGLRGRNIVLYGAGMVGGLVKERLFALGLGDFVRCFAVTNAEKNRQHLGLDVVDIHIVDSDRSCVLICALESNQESMIRELKKCGISDWIAVTNDFVDEMETNFLLAHQDLEKIKSCYDVAMFSQDNNTSSGAFISMVNLCEELQDQSDLRILVILPRYGDGERMLEQKGIDYTYAARLTRWICPAEEKKRRGQNKEDSGGNNILADEEEVQFLQSFIRKTGARIVHMSGMFVFAGAYAAINESIPVIWHIRENIFTQGNCFINDKEAYRLLNSCDTVICTSEYVKNSYSGLNGNNKRIIYNGADEEKFYLKRQIFEQDKKRIVLVGYITKRKGQEVLVDAMHELQKNESSLPEVTFVGGADPEYLLKLQGKVSEYGLDVCIRFAGKTSEPEKYYQAADIAISATNGGEGFDRVRIEAMLSGCLLISNDMGAAMEIVDDGKTGFLYKTGDAVSLAEMIQRACDDIDRSRQIALAGQELCLRKFTKKTNAKNVLSLYREYLDK